MLDIPAPSARCATVCDRDPLAELESAARSTHTPTVEDGRAEECLFDQSMLFSALPISIRSFHQLRN